MSPVTRVAATLDDLYRVKGKAELLIEYKVEKGKKVLRSIHCDSVHLRAYGGTECQWVCMEKLSPKKSPKERASQEKEEKD